MTLKLSNSFLWMIVIPFQIDIYIVHFPRCELFAHVVCTKFFLYLFLNPYTCVVCRVKMNKFEIISWSLMGARLPIKYNSEVNRNSIVQISTIPYLISLRHHFGSSFSAIDNKAASGKTLIPQLQNYFRSFWQT